MTRARTLADMISDGVIGTTELADDAITPVKLDETGNYQVAQLEISGSSSLHDALRLTSTSSTNGAGAILSYEIDGADRASMRGYIDGSTLGGNLISFTSDSSGNLQERTRINSDGHFGVASSVNANWESVRDVIQLRHGALSTNNDTQFAMSANHYYDGSESRYARAGQATMYQQLYGRHEFYLTGTGAQDAAITYSEALRLDTAGATFNEASLDRDFRVESDGNTHALFVDAGNDQVVVGGSLDLDAKLSVIGSKSTTAGIPNTQLTVYDNSAMAANTGGAITFWGNYTTGGAGAEGASIEAVKANSTSGNYQYGIWLKSRTHGGAMDSRLYMDQAQTIFNESGFDTDFRVESDSLAHAITVDAGNNKVGIGGSVQFGAGPVLQVAGVGGGPNTTGSLASGILSVTAGNDGLAIGTRNVSPFGVWMQSGWQGSMSSNHYPITMNPLGANVAIGNEYNPPNKLTVKGDASVSTYLYSSNPKYTFNGSGYNGAYSVSTQLIKLGTWNTQQNGEDLHIKVFIGSGYNAGESQIAIYDLYWRTSNGSSNISGSSGAFYANGWVTYTMMGGTYSPIDMFYVDQNSSTSYTVYMRSNTLIGNSNYYSVDTGNQGGWTHDAAVVDTASSPLTNYVTKDPSDNRILTTYNKTAFAAKMNATTNSAGTAYPYHTIATNRNSAFSTSTNRFTAPYDGRFVVGFSGWTNYASNYLYSGIYKNGSAINATDFGNLHLNNGSTSLHVHGGVHVVLDLLEGDYVQWMRTGGGSLYWSEFDAYAHDV